MKTFHSILIAGTIVLFAAGCSSPGDDAEAQLRQLVDSDSQSNIKLVSFSQKEGREAKISTDEDYVVTFEAKIEIENTGTWVRDADGNRFRFSTQQRSGGGMADLLGSIQNEVPVQQGQQIMINGTMTGSKTENGWKFGLTSERIMSN